MHTAPTCCTANYVAATALPTQTLCAGCLRFGRTVAGSSFGGDGNLGRLPRAPSVRRLKTPGTARPDDAVERAADDRAAEPDAACSHTRKPGGVY